MILNDTEYIVDRNKRMSEIKNLDDLKRFLWLIINDILIVNQDCVKLQEIMKLTQEFHQQYASKLEKILNGEGEEDKE